MNWNAYNVADNVAIVTALNSIKPQAKHNLCLAYTMYSGNA